jgi:hypothetical protein
MKKSIGYIELSCWPLAVSSDGKDGANGDWFDDRREGFTEINTSTLCEAANHPAFFIAIKRAIRFKLVSEDPLAGYDMSTD